MKVTLLSHTPHAEEIIYKACRTCYSESDPSGISISDPEKIQKLIKEVLSFEHFSVLEHATFTFAVSGVSRALSHQLVRHRVASYSQQSQRYVRFQKLDSDSFVVPEKIKKNKDLFKEFSNSIKLIMQNYKNFLDKGVDAEDARYILPQAIKTNLIMTMNFRELIHASGLRLCERAQWEIRGLFKEIVKKTREKSAFLGKFLLPKCFHSGVCTERVHCGKYKFPQRNLL
jgi:thymidylate synthase (FAD)